MQKKVIYAKDAQSLQKTYSIKILILDQVSRYVIHNHYRKAQISNYEKIEVDSDN